MGVKKTVFVVGTSNYLHSSAIIPPDSLRFQVGCGTLLRFWKDTWFGNSPLYLRFNRVFRLEQDKDCLILDSNTNGQWCWNWFRSDLGVYNDAYLRDMLNEISQVDILSDSDTCVWSITHDIVFSVGVTRRYIDAHLLPSLDPPTTWDKSLFRKVNIFIWRLFLDRLSHRLNLSSRGIEILEIYFPSCNGNVESRTEPEPNITGCTNKFEQ